MLQFIQIHHFHQVEPPLVPNKSTLRPNLNAKFQISNHLNNKNEIPIGKNGKIKIENDYHNANVDGSYTRIRKLEPGVKEDTQYKGGVGVKLDGDTKGINFPRGKTYKATKGINYQTHETKYKVFFEGINDSIKGNKQNNVNKSNNNKKDNKLIINRREQNNQITFKGSAK